MSSWFTGLQLNTGITQETQNKSSFLISLNSSSIQLGSAIGSSLAAIVISLFGIQHIVFIALLASLGMTLIHSSKVAVKNPRLLEFPHPLPLLIF
jgi:predicted MFS family arabinose efflux permease